MIIHHPDRGTCHSIETLITRQVRQFWKAYPGQFSKAPKGAGVESCECNARSACHWGCAGSIRGPHRAGGEAIRLLLMLELIECQRFASMPDSSHPAVDEHLREIVEQGRSDVRTELPPG